MFVLQDMHFIICLTKCARSNLLLFSVEIKCKIYVCCAKASFGVAIIFII